MRRNLPAFGFLTALLVVFAVFVGCGKKGDPVPARATLPRVAGLSTASLQEGIVLGWSLDVGGEGIGGFKILRSVTVRGSEACPGCPHDHRFFKEVALADGRLRRDGAAGFRYIDTDVTGGAFYSYRIAVCDRAGRCGEASDEAGLIHTGN